MVVGMQGEGGDYMKKYLTPLWVFVFGNLCLLVVFLFLPAVGTAGEQLASNTASMAPVFWGWTWVVSSIKLWVFLVFEGAVLFMTAVAFLKVR